MKHILLAVLAVCTLSILSCSSVSDDTTVPEASPSAQSTSVQFAIPALANQLAIDYDDMSTCATASSGSAAGATEATRATLAEQNMGYLYCLVDGTLVKTQTSTDSDFGSPSLTMTYGTHTVSFFACTKPLTITNDTVTSSDGTVRETYAYTYSLTVSSSMATQSLALDRIVSCMRYVINDALPTNAASLTVTFAPHYASASATTLLATVPDGSAVGHTKTWDVTSYVGTSKNAFSVYTFCPSLTDEFTATSTITVKDASGTTIASHTFADAGFKANRRTVVTGNFFASASSNAITLNTEWKEDNNISVK